MLGHKSLPGRWDDLKKLSFGCLPAGHSLLDGRSVLGHKSLPGRRDDKFAGPLAQGVSECFQQSPVPGHCSGYPKVSLARGFANSDLLSQLRASYLSALLPVQKSMPKSMTFFIDFGSQNGSQIHLKS